MSKEEAMKIIRTTIDDFVNSELDEWGYDYVEAQFAQGYEPMLVNGIWTWRKPVSLGIFDSNNTVDGLSRQSKLAH